RHTVAASPLSPRALSRFSPALACRSRAVYVPMVFWIWRQSSSSASPFTPRSGLLHCADHFAHRPDHDIRAVKLDVMRCVGHELVPAVGRPRGFLIVQRFPGDTPTVVLITR